MPYWIYTSESLPSPELAGKPGYSPEILESGYVSLPAITAGEWISFSELFYRTTDQSSGAGKEHAANLRRNRDGFYTMRHRDWRDKTGTREFIAYADLAAVVKARWGSRGVVVLDHEPDAKEKAKIARESEDSNLAFRMRIVEDYEERLKQRAVGETVSTRVTPYENECYEVLGLMKPYSVEAMRAQRHPGQSVSEDIANALERLFTRLQDQQQKAPAAAK